jgi:hypothetical protein
MDRFSDGQLTSTFYNPKFANALKQVLEPIASNRKSNNAIRDADEGVKLLREHLSVETDPLFFDWLFVYSFLGYWKNHTIMQEQITQKLSSPLFMMISPAFFCFSYDHKNKTYRDYPLANWLDAAESVNYEGVLPCDRIYVDESLESKPFTSMAALANSPIWHALGILPYDVTKIHPFPFSRDGHFIAWLASIGRKEFVRLCQTHNLTTILDSFEKESALLKARIREQRRII